jgi:hypothetical protein
VLGYRVSSELGVAGREELGACVGGTFGLGRGLDEFPQPVWQRDVVGGDAARGNGGDVAARTLDFSRPTAVMMLGVLGTVRDDEEAFALVQRYVQALPAGSYLVLEDGTKTVKPQAAAQAEQLRDEGQVYSYELRTPERIARFFDGLELIEPGVESVSRWRYESEAVHGAPAKVDAYCGMARKA